MLKEIFDTQNKLQKTLGNFPLGNEMDRQKYINLNILSCLDELSEVLRETAWKNPRYIRFGWKKEQKFNEEKYKEELVDLFHFFINLSLAVGMDSTELYERFMKKNKINVKRNEDGY